jgi:hypothetical protein
MLTPGSPMPTLTCAIADGTDQESINSTMSR